MQEYCTYLSIEWSTKYQLLNECQVCVKDRARAVLPRIHPLDELLLQSILFIHLLKNQYSTPPGIAKLKQKV